jgi:hypothetical protein
MLRVCCACSPLCLSCLSDSTEKRRLPPLMFSLASEHSVSAPPELGDRVANPCADEETCDRVINMGPSYDAGRMELIKTIDSVLATTYP